MKTGMMNLPVPNSTRRYSGKAGNGAAKIKIKSSFGSVRLVNMGDKSVDKENNDEDDDKDADKIKSEFIISWKKKRSIVSC